MSRLNELTLTQWTDPAGNPRSSLLRAKTHIAYGANAFQENHFLEATLESPFVNVMIELDQPGSPRNVLKRYTAQEVRDTHGTFTYENLARADAAPRPHAANVQHR